MKKILFLLFSLFSLSDALVCAQKPKLLVNIVVDGLRSDYIELLWDDFGDGGFKRLIQGGCYAPFVKFPYLNVGRSADYATLMTGSVPAYHGVCADTYWDVNTGHSRSCLYDKQAQGINTSLKLSPASISASTIADELRLRTRGKGKTVSIAIEPEMALILSGHKGRAVWISSVNGQWATTTAYGESLPSWASKSNADNLAGEYISKTWTNAYSPTFYKENSAQRHTSPSFSYRLQDLDFQKRVRLLRGCPFVNSMVCETAIDAVRDDFLGVDDEPDMLNLQLTVCVSDLPSSMGIPAEVQDMYYRLDGELQDFINDIEELCGESNVLYVLSAPQVEYVSPERMQTYGIPSGYFVSERSMSLLNTYLMAQYGQADFVSGYYHGQIFLNKDEIKRKGLNVDSVEINVANFMTRFEGVQTAFRAQDMDRVTNDNPQVSLAKNAFQYGKTGDILIYLKPGWVDVPTVKEKIGISTRSNNYAPLIFYGSGVKKTRLNRSVSVLDIAPTIDLLMGLPFPNAAQGEPIFELLNPSARPF